MSSPPSITSATLPQPAPSPTPGTATEPTRKRKTGDLDPTIQAQTLESVKGSEGVLPPLARSRKIPHLPHEILRQIANHLDVPSALRLTTACKALRDAGEMKVWESVVIGSETDSRGHQSLQHMPAPERLAEVKGLCEYFASSISAHPLRAESINHLLLEPHDDIAEPLVKLLKLVAPYLLSLTILPLQNAIQPSRPGRFNDLLFGAQGIRNFPRCKTLRVLVMEPMLRVLRNLLQHSPVLTRLDIDLIDLYLQDDRVLDDLPQMPKLIDIRIEGMSTEFERPFFKLLDSMPNLDCIHLRGDWGQSFGSSACVKLSSLRRVKRLVWGIDGGNDIKMHKGDVLPGCVEYVNNVDDLEESNEFYLDCVLLPRHSKIERYGVITGPRMPLSDYATLGLGVAKLANGFDTKALRMGSREVRHLGQARNLKEIHFLTESDPAIYEKNYEPFAPNFNPLFVPPSHWEAAGTRGILIRTYTNPRDPHELYHLRVLTRCEMHSNKRGFVGAKRAWHDMAHYRGRTVSVAALLFAYTSSGMDPNWTEPGRGMALKPVSWALLDGWREEAGDETSDDGFTDDDDDDDDDDSDNDDDASDGMANDMDIYDEMSDGIGWMDEQHGMVGNDGEWETDEEDLI